jgi:hypothetical protein
MLTIGVSLQMHAFQSDSKQIPDVQQVNQSKQDAQAVMQDAQNRIAILLSKTKKEIEDIQKWVKDQLNIAKTPQEKLRTITQELRTRAEIVEQYIQSVEFLSKPMKLLNPKLYATTQELILALRASNEFLITLADRLDGIVLSLENMLKSK